MLQDEPKRDEERHKRKRGASEHRRAVDVAVQLPEARGGSVRCHRFVPHPIQGSPQQRLLAYSWQQQHSTGEQLSGEFVGKKKAAADQVLRRAANELNLRRAGRVGVPVPKKRKKKTFLQKQRNKASTEARVSSPYQRERATMKLLTQGKEEPVGAGAEISGPRPLQGAGLEWRRRTRRRREGRSEGRVARDGRVEHFAAQGTGTVATPENGRIGYVDR